MLLSGTSAGYQTPFKSLISGHIIPHERIAPRKRDRLTRWEQIIPAPTYVRLKSKKNLKSKKHTSQSGENSY
jgi:hypothetical protein